MTTATMVRLSTEPLHLDYETRSRVDLKKCGAYRYAMDFSTSILCAAWAVGDNEVNLWRAHDGEPCPKELKREMQRRRILAWNTQFERLISWYVGENDHGLPKIPIEQWWCSAAQARLNGLPGFLDGAAKALKLKHQKDFRGTQLIRYLCISNKDDEFNEHAEKYNELCEYCIQDVETERDAHHHMRPMTEREHLDFIVSERINDRGIRLDLPLAHAAVAYADEEQAELVAEIAELTGGDCTKARGPKLTKWVYDHLTAEDQRKCMHVYKSGELKLTFDKNARSRLLDDAELPSAVRNVIEASDLAQASSTGKFKAMINGADLEDHRARGCYIFSGAASTQRWSATRIQPHNMPRDKFKDPKPAARMIRNGYETDAIREALDMGIMGVLKRLIRHSVRAEPNHVLVASDWSAVEGIGCPWLAGEAGEVKLDIYRNATKERDVYCITASEIYEEPVTRDGSEKMEGYRQIGKVAELSLQYGGAVGAFQAMAKGYGVKVEDAMALRIVRQWRAANQWAVDFWAESHNAAVLAMQNPGEAFDAGRVQYLSHRGGLYCLLPSGRFIPYPAAVLEWKENRWGQMAWIISALKAAWKPKADEPEWPRHDLWPGLLVENSTQATCRDLLVDALRRCDEEGIPIVLHTHDEAVSEVPRSQAKAILKKQERIMLTSSPWAEGLPLSVASYIDQRFKKD